ncbi:MAG: hypothetical protein ACPL7C_03510 [Anaerolineae bacterium]|jgi:hypothetical protein
MYTIIAIVQKTARRGDMAGITIASFILRFIRESSPDALPGEWRGIVRHIQTGDQYGFTRLEEAMAFIARRVESRVTEPDEDSPPYPTHPDSGGRTCA